MKKLSHILSVIVLAMFLGVMALVLVGCGNRSDAPAGLLRGVTHQSAQDFNEKGVRIGCVTGTIWGSVVEEVCPEATVCYFSSTPDLVTALNKNKIDAFADDSPLVQYLGSVTSGMSYISESVKDTNLAHVFSKTEEGQLLQEQFNQFLAQAKDNGTLDLLTSKWLAGAIADTSILDYESLPAPNGVLTFATTFTQAPVSYEVDGEVAGFEVELAVLFCKAYGYGLDIMETAFDGLLPAVVSGKCDFAAGAISITEERAESVLFSNPTTTSNCIMVYTSTEEDIAAANATITDIKDLAGKRVGILLGSACSDAARAVVGNQGEVLVFNSMSDLPIALESGKIDCYVNDYSVTCKLIEENPSNVMVGDMLEYFDICFALAKGSERILGINSELNDYIARIKADGTLQEFEDKWINGTEEEQIIDWSILPSVDAARDVINMGVSSSIGAPHCYIKDGVAAGFDIDVLVHFCAERGYALTVSDMDFSGLIAAISSGKCDIGACGIIKTEERAQTMLFSDPIFENGAACVVRDKDAGKVGFFERISDNINKTFVKEGRWKLFVTGILNTLTITLGSLIFGTLLGFLIFLLYRLKRPLVNKVIDFFIWLITGMPVVVLLMILFYVIFGSVSISGVIVSIIGFTLIFAAAVLKMLKVGVGAIDVGQEEAALALGYTRYQAFYKIVLPQAIAQVLPVYKADMVDLLKGTAVVGYVAVRDIAKVGDIIRSRTYEAFFPLISVAIVYFILAALLKLLVKVLSRRFNPENRSEEKILQGIKR